MNRDHMAMQSCVDCAMYEKIWMVMCTIRKIESLQALQFPCETKLLINKPALQWFIEIHLLKLKTNVKRFKERSVTKREINGP
jgi:hypothetical protein